MCDARTRPATDPARRIAMPHRLSQSLQRILEVEEELRRFFYESAYARRDPADPQNCDFVAGNPQEIALPEYVESLQRWTVPQDKDWYAYKFNEPYAQEAAAAGLRERRGVPFEADDILVTDGGVRGPEPVHPNRDRPRRRGDLPHAPVVLLRGHHPRRRGPAGARSDRLRDVGPGRLRDRSRDHGAHLRDHRELAEQPERQDLPARDPAGAGGRADGGFGAHRSIRST